MPHNVGLVQTNHGDAPDAVQPHQRVGHAVVLRTGKINLAVIAGDDHLAVVAEARQKHQHLRARDGSRNVNDWYPQLTDDPAFMEQVRARWRELRMGLLSDEALDARVAQLAAPVARAVARDYAKWPVAQVYANPGIVRGPTVEGWDQQLQALRDYLVRRAAWIDAQYP
jgi:hypothetical protein